MSFAKRFVFNSVKTRPQPAVALHSRSLHASTSFKMPRIAETASYKFNHTMLRIKDPKVTIPFYTEVLGMDLIDEQKNSDFTLYFLGYDNGDGKLAPEERKKARFHREGILELTHNHGTESDASFKGYHNGNADPRGYGHIAITVEDVNAACERLEKLGVPFQKKLTDGRMKDIAFALDPDGYWVEILGQPKL